MQKGGNTKEPNPIFLFDVNPKETSEKDVEYEEALELFYNNNYIFSSGQKHPSLPAN